MSETDEPLGNDTFPRYYHRETGFVEHITDPWAGIWHRDRAKGRLKRRVKAVGADITKIEYCAAMGASLSRALRGEGQ